MERIIPRPTNGRSIMKRAAFGLLCLFVLIPAAAFAQINSFGPTSFYSFEFEQNATFHAGGTTFAAPAPVITCDHHSGDLFPLGETIVHCTATDSFGSASGSFPVFVFDSGGPTVTVPADIITSNPVVTFTVTANDVIDGPVTPHCDPPSGS